MANLKAEEVKEYKPQSMIGQVVFGYFAWFIEGVDENRKEKAVCACGGDLWAKIDGTEYSHIAQCWECKQVYFLLRRRWAFVELSEKH